MLRVYSKNLKARFPLVDPNTDFIAVKENSWVVEYSYRDGQYWSRTYGLSKRNPFRPIGFSQGLSHRRFRQMLAYYVCEEKIGYSCQK